MWVLVRQKSELDLLHTTSLGRTWLDAPAATTAWVALADDNDQNTGFAVTAGGGLTWRFWTFPERQSQHQVPIARGLKPASAGNVAAVDARQALMLTPDPAHKSRGPLYATSDGGATWSSVAVFRTGFPRPS